jgi:heptosyltransferase-2
LTAPESVDLLANHPNLREIWPLDPAAVAMLQVREFNVCINLDLGPDSLALAALARAEHKFGYALGFHGEPVILNPEAEEWYHMSHSDLLKRRNRRTYQDHMFSILGLEPDEAGIIVNCPESEREFAREWLRGRLGGDPKGPVVGLNLGAGGRWKQKAWPIERFGALARLLYETDGATILLLTGEEEKETKETLMSGISTPVYDPGSRNPLPRFAAFVNLSDVVVTGDTLALHAALGLRRRVVALFGPTSMAEIEMYGLGRKISSGLDCLECYRETCDKHPTCMELITVPMVQEAVRQEIRLAREGNAR